MYVYSLNSFHNALTPWMEIVFCKDIIIADFDWINQKASKLFYLCWILRLIFVSVCFSYVPVDIFHYFFIMCLSEKRIHQIYFVCPLNGNAVKMWKMIFYEKILSATFKNCLFSLSWPTRKKDFFINTQHIPVNVFRRCKPIYFVFD